MKTLSLVISLREAKNLFRNLQKENIKRGYEKNRTATTLVLNFSPKEDGSIHTHRCEETLGGNPFFNKD